MNIRIFRQPTRDIQPDGQFYIDTLQFQNIYHSLSTVGIAGMPVQTLSKWFDVEIVEADSF